MIKIKKIYITCLLIVFTLLVASCMRISNNNDYDNSNFNSFYDTSSDLLKSFESILSESSQPILWNEEAQIALSAIKDVLQNKKEYFCAVYGRNIYLKNFHSDGHMIDYKTNEYYDTEYSYMDHVYSQFSIIDMDGDGIPELLLESSIPSGKILVFNYENGIVYGNVFSYRGMKFVKPDGSFESSSSGVQIVVGRINFSKNRVFYTEICLLNGLDNVYRINGKNVNREEASSFWEEWRKENAEWYPYNEENIEKYLGSYN